MKTRLLLLSTMLLTVATFAQDITVEFSNARNTNDGIDDFYEADILVSSQAEFKLGDGQIYFDYNTAAFGENIAASGNFEFLIPEDAILDEPAGFVPFYSTNFVDNTNTILSTNYFTSFSAGALAENNVVSTTTILFSIKIKYEDVNEDPGITFNTTINNSTEQFFTACGPFDTPANKDCTNEPGTQITAENATFDSTGASLESLAIVNFGSADTAIDVYPNPVVDTFVMKGATDVIDTAMIYNINGAIVKEVSPKVFDQDIFVADLFPGVYFLQLTSGSESTTVKLLKL